MFKRTFLPLFTLSLLAPVAAQADDFAAAMETFVTENAANWASDPMFVAAIRAQNLETAGYDQTRIDELDALWRGQVGSADAALIQEVMANPAAIYLRQQVEAMGGSVTEAFIMDQHGLNVAASHVTSDYWQGDEAKYQETFARGPGQVHYGDIELDQSTQTVQGQVSMTIVDDATGEPIGAMTIGINLTALM